MKTGLKKIPTFKTFKPSATEYKFETTFKKIE